jgi:hypothetical protein
MAKKAKKKEDETKKVGAICDCKNINSESLIRTIRGQKVMFDSDLAMLYGVTTSRLNEQVKRNMNRFPDDFMFQLTKDDWNALRSKIATLKNGRDATGTGDRYVRSRRSNTFNRTFPLVSYSELEVFDGLWDFWACNLKKMFTFVGRIEIKRIESIWKIRRK